MPPKKKPVEEPVESEITGPSDTTVPGPVITMGAITAPVVRTGGQGISAEFIIQGLEVFDLYHPNEGQGRWLLIALTILLSFVQNQIEKRVGRRLVGALT